MSITQPAERFGNFDPTPPKRCACGARGEWPGRLCPTCRATTPTPATPPPAPVAGEIIVGPTLSELAEMANTAHARARAVGLEFIESVITAGSALLEARRRVDRGSWLAWMEQNVRMDVTTAYRYMRCAEYADLIRKKKVSSIEGALQLLSDQPRRGHGPRGYTDADKRAFVDLADQVGIKPAARALGVSPSTIHKWASPNSPARGKSYVSRQVTTERIERMAGWLVDRFGGYDYPERVTAEVRVDAAKALAAVFAEADT